MQQKTEPSYVFDFDSTIVTVESLDELAKIALQEHDNSEKALDKLVDITNQGMAGKISFDESLEERLKLFSATTDHVRQLTDVLLENISPSFQEHKEWLHEHASDIYIISGGFIDYIVPVIETLGLKRENVYANKFLYNAAHEIIGYDQQVLLSQSLGKVKQVAALNLERPIVVIGDGFTDYEIRAQAQADLFCAFTETVQRQNVIKKADLVLSVFEPEKIKKTMLSGVS